MGQHVPKTLSRDKGPPKTRRRNKKLFRIIFRWQVLIRCFPDYEREFIAYFILKTLRPRPFPPELILSLHDSGVLQEGDAPID